MIRKLVPVHRTKHGQWLAPAVVRAVFDTNGAGELVEVPFRRNTFDGIEFLPVYEPVGQVYVEIHLKEEK